MIDWSKGLTVVYRLMLMDPVTWRDTEEIGMIKGGASRTNEGLRQSADITVSDFERQVERYVREEITNPESDLITEPECSNLTDLT